MSITAANVSYQNQGPTASGQVLADNSASSTEVAFVGEATFTLDGSATSATLNFIDGTATLKFGSGATGPTANATGVVAFVIGGTQLAATPISVVGCGAPSSTGCTVYFSAAGTSANTIKVAVFILK